MRYVECDGCGYRAVAGESSIKPIDIKIDTLTLARDLCSSCLDRLKRDVDPSSWPRPKKEIAP